MKIVNYNTIKLNIKKCKLPIVVFLLAICIIITFYFHLKLNTDTAFTHFFYIPIILSTLWWQRNGVFVAIFLGVFLLLSHIAPGMGSLTADDYSRVLMFLVIGLVMAFLNERTHKSQKSLKNSEERFRQVVDNADEWVWETDTDGLYTYSSKAVKNILGYKPEEIVGKKFFYDLFHPEEKKILKNNAFKMIAQKKPFEEFSNRNIHKNGDTVWLLTTGVAILDKNGNLTGYRGVDRDITWEKLSENRIKNSIMEKEILLKEIHHRVKNNMQIVASLIDLQSEYVANKHDLNLFNNTRNRIHTMAFIHEDMYHSDNFSKINFAQYIKKLTHYLTGFHDIDLNKIKFTINIDDIYLGLDRAIPCAQIINEIITNSLKHAFTGREEGEIVIDFKNENSNYTLAISDNGIGMPGDFDFKNIETLGLQLVKGLTDQLSGNKKLDGSDGVKFKITF